MADQVPEPPIPELRSKEQRREKKGAGIVSGQGGVAGVNADLLVPGPVIQAGKVLLGIGGAAGTAPPTLLKALASLATTKLPVIIAAVLACATTIGLYKMVRPPSGAPPGKNVPFRGGIKPLDEPKFGGEAEVSDSLGYLMAGNQSGDRDRDSASLNEGLMQAAQVPGEEESDPVEEKKAAPAAAAAAPEEKKDPDASAIAAAAKAVAGAGGAPGTSLASGIGMWKGVNRKFDSFAEFALGRDRILGAAGGLKQQKSPYPGSTSSGLSGRLGNASALNQLFSVHKKSRESLNQSSGEGKAATAGQAFGSSGKVQRGKIRTSGKKNEGEVEIPRITFDSNDGGPISTPFSGKAPAPSLGGTDDVSPWTSDIERAHDKLTDASSLVTAIGLLAPFKMLPIVGPIVMAIQGVLFGMVMSYTNTVTEIGNSVHGDWVQPEQGDIVTTGSVITNAAAAAAMAAPVSVTAWTSVLAGVAGIAALVGVLLATQI